MIGSRLLREQQFPNNSGSNSSVLQLNPIQVAILFHDLSEDKVVLDLNVTVDHLGSGIDWSAIVLIVVVNLDVNNLPNYM